MTGGNLNKRSLPIFILSCLLALGAAVAYALPEPQSEVPPRILLLNTGGRVVFDHKAHTQYANVSCQSCHHELKIPERELAEATDVKAQDVFACGTCHGNKEGTTFVADHQKTFDRNDGGKTCLACHHTDDLSSLQLAENAPAPKDFAFTACNSCHFTVPERMDAFHNKCFGCHDTMKKGPSSKAPCAQCHTP